MKTTQDAKALIENYDGRPLRIMEVCGTHTHEIFRLGIRSLLPESVKLISGPGCPVCVTPAGYIDEAVFLALEKGVTICTFGDLVRVPGTKMSLAGARGSGAKIKTVYSPQDAHSYAARHPEEQVCFLSVGFETTTPSSCIALENAVKSGISNFSLLTANKTMPGAYRALKGSADAFLYPGHVHAITGTALCREMAAQGVSGVIAGFTADELITALAVILVKIKSGEPFFVNCYPRVVTDEGNRAAAAYINKYMKECDAIWRGLGKIEGSGLMLRDEYASYDARIKYDIPEMKGKGQTLCRCGDILKGDITPPQCPLFGKACTPDHPAGACMVSAEGACSAFFQYGCAQQENRPRAFGCGKRKAEL